MKFRTFSFVLLFLAALALQACGGSNGSSGVPSGNVPYLLGPVQVTWLANAVDNTKYDVTVSLDADGPDGVMFVDLWIIEDGGGGDSRPLDMVNISGNTWEATTNTFLPLAPGNYYIDSIILDDEDVFASPGVIVKSGWYFINPMLSNARYTIDERILDYADLGSGFLYYRLGVGNIGITNFALP